MMKPHVQPFYEKNSIQFSYMFSLLSFHYDSTSLIAGFSGTVQIIFTLSSRKYRNLNPFGPVGHSAFFCLKFKTFECPQNPVERAPLELNRSMIVGQIHQLARNLSRAPLFEKLHNEAGTRSYCWRETIRFKLLAPSEARHTSNP